MSTFNLYFLDRSPSPTKKHFEVAVAVSESTQDSDGRQLITPNCVNADEIDYWCDKLVAELEKVRQAAKRKIAEN